MLISRTTGSASVVPELVYPDVDQAVDWLCETFGFDELWRAGGHRARLEIGNGVVIVADAEFERVAPEGRALRTHAVMVKIEDVDAHYDHARGLGARVLSPPTTHSYGERQYSVEDLAGHKWTFTQTIADVAPEDWGGTSRALDVSDSS